MLGVGQTHVRPVAVFEGGSHAHRTADIMFVLAKQCAAHLLLQLAYAAGPHKAQLLGLEALFEAFEFCLKFCLKPLSHLSPTYHTSVGFGRHSSCNRTCCVAFL